jgi:hypothetical protein
MESADLMAVAEPTGRGVQPGFGIGCDRHINPCSMIDSAK